MDHQEDFQKDSAHSVCTTSEPCTTLGALASVAGGARNHAGWAWLTGRRVAQNGDTPLHNAADFFYGHGWTRETLIKALVAAKADVNDNVRGLRMSNAVRAREGAAWGLYSGIAVWIVEPEVVARPNRLP